MPQLVLPYPDFVAGTKILSSQVDANNSAITTWANGNIDDINIKAAAGIVRSKLAATEPATVAHSARGTATSTGNFDSFDVELLTSVWDGTAAQTRKMGLRTKVTSLTAYKLALLDNAGTEVASVDQAGAVAAAVLALTGLTGATAASRYVGATTSGAPTSGTFAVGDFVVDQTGKVWICTAAGTPGTWTQVGSDRVAKAGDTMTGALTLSGNPTAALHAATKQYVDSASASVIADPVFWMLKQ